MIGPKDIPVNQNEVDTIIKLVDEKLVLSYNVFQNKREVIIYGEYSKEARNEASKLYKEAGWKEVEHKTSSENGERPGLTLFTFYN